MPRPDAVTERLQRHAEYWRSLAGIGDGRAARLIREDRIDVLVDLAGHTGGHRLPVLARRAAPVQAGQCGYPATAGRAWLTGSPAAGRPPGCTERCHAERLVRLPEVARCYQPPEGAPGSDLFMTSFPGAAAVQGSLDEIRPQGPQ